MAIGLYFDVHVDYAIAGQLRLRNVDVLTAQEDHSSQLIDEDLLVRASALGRPLVTHDLRLQAMAESWITLNRPFFGVIFAHPMQVSIGQSVRDLEIIAKATESSDWSSTLLRLPL